MQKHDVTGSIGVEEEKNEEGSSSKFLGNKRSSLPRDDELYIKESKKLIAAYELELSKYWKGYTISKE